MSTISKANWAYTYTGSTCMKITSVNAEKLERRSMLSSTAKSQKIRKSETRHLCGVDVSDVIRDRLLLPDLDWTWFKT